MKKTFRALVWRDSNGALYWPDGASKMISCDNSYDGIFGVNIEGVIVPAASATKQLNVDGTDEQHAQVSVPAGNVFMDTNAFGLEPGFKVCVRVKDIASNMTYYVDKDSYDAAIGTCNECCTPADCPLSIPEVSVEPTDTTASVSWPEAEGAVGYEYTYTESGGDPCEDPAGPGTLTAELEIALTGLDPETEYCFSVRTVCALGLYSPWSSVAFTTTPTP